MSKENDDVLKNYFNFVNSMYNKILKDSEKFNNENIMLDIDETIL